MPPVNLSTKPTCSGPPLGRNSSTAADCAPQAQPSIPHSSTATTHLLWAASWPVLLHRRRLRAVGQQHFSQLLRHRPRHVQQAAAHAAHLAAQSAGRKRWEVTRAGGGHARRACRAYMHALRRAHACRAMPAPAPTASHPAKLPLLLLLLEAARRPAPRCCCRCCCAWRRGAAVAAAAVAAAAAGRAAPTAPQLNLSVALVVACLWTRAAAGRRRRAHASIPFFSLAAETGVMLSRAMRHSRGAAAGEALDQALASGSEPSPNSWRLRLMGLWCALGVHASAGMCDRCFRAAQRPQLAGAQAAAAAAARRSVRRRGPWCASATLLAISASAARR